MSELKNNNKKKKRSCYAEPLHEIAKCECRISAWFSFILKERSREVGSTHAVVSFLFVKVAHWGNWHILYFQSLNLKIQTIYCAVGYVITFSV